MSACTSRNCVRSTLCTMRCTSPRLRPETSIAPTSGRDTRPVRSTTRCSVARCRRRVQCSRHRPGPAHTPGRPADPSAIRRGSPCPCGRFLHQNVREPRRSRILLIKIVERWHIGIGIFSIARFLPGLRVGRQCGGRQCGGQQQSFRRIVSARIRDGAAVIPASQFRRRQAVAGRTQGTGRSAGVWRIEAGFTTSIGRLVGKTGADQARHFIRIHLWRLHPIAGRTFEPPHRAGPRWSRRERPRAVDDTHQMELSVQPA